MDKHIVLCLTGEDPFHLRKGEVQSQGLMRRVRDTYHDENFASLFLKQVLATHGKVKTARSRMLSFFVEKGHTAALLRPRADPPASWMALMEDIMGSPMVKKLTDNAITECQQKKEFQHISVDATMRIAKRARGRQNIAARRSRGLHMW